MHTSDSIARPGRPAKVRSRRHGFSVASQIRGKRGRSEFRKLRAELMRRALKA